MPETAADAALETRGRILIIDDEEAIRDSLETLLELEGFEVKVTVDAGSGLRELSRRSYDLVLLDLMLPDKSGLDALAEFRETDTQTPVVMLTAYGSLETAIQAIKTGADDFFTKPWQNDKLVHDIDQIIESRRLAAENQLLRREVRQKYSFENIVGKSDAMQDIFRLISQVAPSRSTVLITGESGTGKELVAKAIHANSPRASKPFVPVNSGSIPVDLLESTLFGHIKGAFTSASATREGRFAAANGGTLFLDEVGTLRPETQAKLLRVLQEREFEPVGSNDTIKVDVRIVAATNEDLARMVAEGDFREDLYYRLNVIGMTLPPLRERRSDIPLLIRHFFDRFSAENEKFLDAAGRSKLEFTQDAMAILMDHEWRGNVRELENAVERAVVLATSEQVSAEVLPEALLEHHGVAPRRLPIDFKPAAGASLPEMVEDFERRIVLDELEKAGWNQTETAKRLHVALSTLNQKIQRLGIDIKKRKGSGDR